MRIGNPALKRLVRVISYPLILLPVAIAFYYVNRFGVTVVYRDQWELTAAFSQLSNGTLSLAQLWEPHNEHRFFFPRLAMLVLGRITHWDNVAEMYLILVCLLVTLLCLFLAFGVGRGASIALFVPVAFLIFNLRQHQNMLWGYQITFAFTQMFSILTLYLLYLCGRSTFGRFSFLAALVSGALAAGSSIQGLLVWPVGLLQILISSVQRPRKWILAGAWGLVGSAIWIFYFIDYARSGSIADSLLALTTDPVSRFRHFAALIASSLIWPVRQDVAQIFGVFLLLLAAWSLLVVYRSNRLGDYSFWIGLLLLSLAMLAAITVGRTEIRVENAMASKYATFSVLLMASVYGMLAKLALENRLRSATVLLGILLAVVMLSMPESYIRGFERGNVTEDTREKMATILLNYDTEPEERLRELRRANPQSVRSLSALLERLEYNVFARSQREE
jgi:hypothetical protein